MKRLQSPIGRRLVTFAAALALLAGLPPVDGAAEVHRISDDLTGWYWLVNVTPEQVTDFINENDARIIDLEIHAASPLRLTAAFVRNEGSYASGWWWYYGLTFSQIADLVDEHTGRLIDIERYLVDGNERWAIVMVPNVGDQQKAWWYYAGVQDFELGRLIEGNNARLVDLESYDTPSGRRYAAIMISNTGADAAPWGWFYNVDLATLTGWMNDNNMRLLEFQVRDPAAPTFDAVLISLSYHTPKTWWWYYGVTFETLGGLVDQAGSRITDIDTYLVEGQRRYNVVLLNNSNDLTVEVAGILGWGSDGSTGLYLKEVDGPTLASLQPDFGFEPASTIKAIHHLHALRSVMSGASSLGQLVNYSENYSSSCPIGGAPFTTQTLQETLRRMMVNSDNAATEGITQLYSQAAIENTAQTIAGMTETELNHTLGCGSQAVLDPNVLTLRNIGALWSGVQNLSLVDEPHRTWYYALAQNQDTPGPWWFTTVLQNTVYDAAADLGLPLQIANDYWAATETAWKPGGYTLNGLNYTSVGGVVGLPSCSGATPTEWQHYTFGLFVHGSSAGVLSILQDASAALFRDLIEAELAACAATSVVPIPVAQTMLAPPHPNPFNPRTELSFTLDRSQSARLSIHDPAGREVAVLFDSHLDAGVHTAAWHGRDHQGRPVAAGIYIVRLAAGDEVQTRKLALIK